SGQPLTILEAHEAIRAQADRRLPPRFEPARTGDIRHSYADIGRAREELGWEPITPFVEGIRDLLAQELTV
ncbi:MAG: hypothetical protein KGR26_05305, partial [Cyanobacteria bacterium REEB65]|nr:hypothetical protein [Cyanobacteria bacterium REEB65]